MPKLPPRATLAFLFSFPLAACADTTTIDAPGTTSSFYYLGDIDHRGELIIDGHGSAASELLLGTIGGNGSVAGTNSANPLESLVVQGNLPGAGDGGGLNGTAALLVELPTTLQPPSTVTTPGGSAIIFNFPLTVTGTSFYGNIAFNVPQGVVNARAGVSISGHTFFQPSSLVNFRGPITIDPNSTFTFNLSPLYTVDLHLDMPKLTLSRPDSTAQLYNQLTAMLHSGFDNGRWDGPGINSTSAGADPAHSTGVAMATSDQLTQSAVLHDNASITVGATLYGDNDLSGNVDELDFSNYVAGLKGQYSGWFGGDYNYDGVTDIQNDFPLFCAGFFADNGAPVPQLNQFITSFGLTPAQQQQMRSIIASVPEPTLGSIFIAVLPFLRIHRNRRSPGKVGPGIVSSAI